MSYPGGVMRVRVPGFPPAGGVPVYRSIKGKGKSWKFEEERSRGNSGGEDKRRIFFVLYTFKKQCTMN